MEIKDELMKGLYLLQTVNFRDARGSFQKVLNADFFEEKGLVCNFKELYYSINKKNVIRGMHFQLPPHDHVKMVYVSHGKIIDVVLDLRRDSQTYGKYMQVELDAESGQYIYIPKGFAHGFLSLEDDTIVNYAQTSCYAPQHDSGISYNSFGFNWPVKKAIVSGRDLTFVNFADFKSPF